MQYLISIIAVFGIVANCAAAVPEGWTSGQVLSAKEAVLQVELLAHRRTTFQIAKVDAGGRSSYYVSLFADDRLTHQRAISPKTFQLLQQDLYALTARQRRQSRNGCGDLVVVSAKIDRAESHPEKLCPDLLPDSDRTQLRAWLERCKTFARARF